MESGLAREVQAVGSGNGRVSFWGEAKESACASPVAEGEGDSAGVVGDDGASLRTEVVSGGWGEGEEGEGHDEKEGPVVDVRACATTEGEVGRGSESESGEEGGAPQGAWRGVGAAAAESVVAVGCEPTGREGEEGEGAGETGRASWQPLCRAGLPSSLEAPP